MKDERLSEALRAVPRVAARPDFTRRVLEGLDPQPQPRTGFAGRGILAAATCAGLVAGAGVLWKYQNLPNDSHSSGTRSARGIANTAGSALPRQEAEETLAEIRAEHARLRQEIDRLSVASEPTEGDVIYLGGNENVDFVVDLGRVRTAPGGVAAAAYKPETY